jgi:integrase
MFLRYLAVNGRCSGGLDQALISPPNWSRQSLPRGLSPQDTNRVLALCPTTPVGIRDRAILLLLVRLGLRAGDVAALRLMDLCFQTATLRVCGKGGREVRLPLPQEVGEALLDYLRRGRPRSESDYLFLRAVAPFRPFGIKNRQPGQAVKHVARSALQRAGIQPPTPGAHVFRHTAACEMLRADVDLEGIAAVLRHRCVDTTALYVADVNYFSPSTPIKLPHCHWFVGSCLLPLLVWCRLAVPSQFGEHGGSPKGDRSGPQTAGARGGRPGIGGSD